MPAQEEERHQQKPTRRLLWDPQARALALNHPAWENAPHEVAGFVAFLHDKNAGRSLAALGNYLNYLDWFASIAQTRVTPRQIAYFPRRVERLEAKISQGTATPRQIEQLAGRMEALLADVLEMRTETVTHLRALAENPHSSAFRRQAVASLRKFRGNYAAALRARVRIFFRKRRHYTTAHQLVVWFLRDLKRETGCYHTPKVAALLNHASRWRRANIEFSEDWLYTLASRHSKHD